MLIHGNGKISHHHAPVCKHDTILSMRRIEIPEKELRELYLKEGLSVRAVAERYNCDTGVIVRSLHECEIPARRPTEARIFLAEELRTLYQDQGLSTYSIAEKYKCDPKTIYRHLKLHGIQPRPREKITLSKSNLESLYLTERKSLQGIAEQYSYSASGILKKCKEYGIERRTVSETSTKHSKQDFAGADIEKAYIIGFRLGDLGIRSARNLISVSSGTTKDAQIQLISELFAPYGPVWVGKANEKGALNVSCTLNQSFSFLLPKHANIPAWIVRSGPNFFSFLAGYTDAEGNFGVAGGTARFRLRSYDIGILQGLHTGLAKRGIQSTFRIDRKAGVYGNQKQNKDSWCLTIARMEALHRLLPMLVPLLRHGKRIADAQMCAENIEQRIP